MSSARGKIGALFRIGLIIGVFSFAVPLARAALIRTSVVVSVIPNAPTSLTASASSNSEIDLSWVNNANNANGFVVERSLGNDANFIPIATTSPGVVIYSDTGLAAGTDYFYRVAAYNADGTSFYSNETNATTFSVPLPPAPPVPPSPVIGGGGGGGGGGGYSYSPTPIISQTSAIFKGFAYPLSKVSLLENGQTVAVTEAGNDAVFEVDLSDLASGTYTFGVSAVDPAGNRSALQTFQISVTPGATTIVSGIFFPPTINENLISVKQGTSLHVFGYTVPTTTVTLIVHSSDPIVATTVSDNVGAWFYDIPTDDLALGDHVVMARAANGEGAVTDDSVSMGFRVGSQNVPVPSGEPACPAHGDLNGDCRVNLIDFSIMAYWYGRPNPPAYVLLDGTNAVDLTDFSILAYYWTG
jgi:hypothetical protein